MPSDADLQALKAKEAEILLLRQQLREKSLQRQNARGSSCVKKPSGYSSQGHRGSVRRNNLGSNRWYGTGYHGPNSMVFNRCELPPVDLVVQLDSDSLGSSNYISRTSRAGMTLVSKDIYDRDQAKYRAVQMSLQAKQEKQVEYQKQQDEYNRKVAEKRRAQALRTRISKNRTKTDDCDRIEIDGDKFAVVNQGFKLVMISQSVTPIASKSKTVVWNERTFKRLASGNLKSKGSKYVISMQFHSGHY
jgi:hypothetical protein